MMLKRSDETYNQIFTFPPFLKVVSLTMRDAPREAEPINKAGIEPVVMPEFGNHLNLRCVWTGVALCGCSSCGPTGAPTDLYLEVQPDKYASRSRSHLYRV